MSKLNLSLPISRTKENNHESKEDDAMALQEEYIEIKFLLPDQSTVIEQFKKGHTVEFLKEFLASETGFSTERQKLYLGEKSMLDPYSLTDFPEVESKRKVDIVVKLSADEK